MASLMKKLFDTMPLNGVQGAMANVAGSLKQSTVGQLSRHLTFLESLPGPSVICNRPRPSLLGLGGPDPIHIPIWSYDIPADPSRISQVACRVRDDNFNQNLVATDIEWGTADIKNPGGFRPVVSVVLRGTPIDLPLLEAFRLLSFLTTEGENPGFGHHLWPLSSNYDPSLLHVFVYDVGPGPAGLQSLKAPNHPQSEEVSSLLLRLHRLASPDPDDEENAADFLFKDNLWDASLGAGPVAAKVPERVEISLKPVRVVVACSLTVCRESDDYQPGNPMGVGRLYPHVMVIANAPLDRVDAGVRVTRPKQMTMLDGSHAAHKEMLPQMGSLLVTDANSDCLVLSNIPTPTTDPPCVFWANLFNYYVPDPFSHPAIQSQALHVVKRLVTTSRNKVGLVSRDVGGITGRGNSANAFRVTKMPRQGAFDNIHIAPKMHVTDSIARVENGDGHAAFTTYADWKMDQVTMAPFCAHDCLHFHWRWTDNQNTEQGSWGWGPTAPNAVVGATMVPQNQDVFVAITAPGQLTYLAQAYGADANQWQPFFHHGGGYGLTAGPKTTLAKVSAEMMDHDTFKNAAMLTVLGEWALFYWRLRYTLKRKPGVTDLEAVLKSIQAFEPVERFGFQDMVGALDL
jgi:hypothetical protein